MRSISCTILTITLSIAVSLAGCATRPSDKELNRERIEQSGNVEIFYSREEQIVMHVLGEGTTRTTIGLSGLLGPAGMLVALAGTYAANSAALDETTPRTRAFNEALATEIASQDMNAEMAKRIAMRLERIGKTVKLTQVPRLPGEKPGLAPAETQPVRTRVGGPLGASPAEVNAMADPVAPTKRAPAIALSGYSVTPGYTPLVLRVTTGYASPDALSDFRSMAIVEYALVDPQTGTYLVEGKLTSVDRPHGPTYFSWPELLENASVARTQIRTSLFETSAAVPALMFDFGKL